MSNLNLKLFSEHLQQMNFNLLFTDVLGWSHPPASERAWRQDEAKGLSYRQRMVAELAGVAVLEIAEWLAGRSRAHVHLAAGFAIAL